MSGGLSERRVKAIIAVITRVARVDPGGSLHLLFNERIKSTRFSQLESPRAGVVTNACEIRTLGLQPHAIGHWSQSMIWGNNFIQQ